MPVVRLCRTCAHWKAHENTADRGDCRRNPPAVGVLASDIVGVLPAESVWSAWPETQPDQRCGEWSAGEPALAPLERYADELDRQGDTANAHTAGMLYQIAERLRDIARGGE